MAYDPINNSAVALPNSRGSSLPFITNITQPGRPMFIYNDGDSASTVRGAGYFTNGAELGMVVGSIVFGTVTEGGGYLNTVSAIDATTGAATVVAFTYG